jgi:hypothetical protein
MASRIPLPFFVCSAAAVFFLFCLGRTIIPNGIGPAASISPAEMDFGSVEVGESVSRKFSVINTGWSRLIIRDVKSSCECSLARISRRDVAPGASVAIDVVFKPAGPGPRRHQILIQTNDPDHPAMVFTLSATGVP